MLGLLATILPTIQGVIDRVVPDRAAAEKAKIELTTMVAKGELDQMAAQIQANVEAAKSPHLFVAGARPAMIWLCGLILFNNYIVVPYAIAFGLDAIPRLDDQAIMPIILGLLGLGGFRSVEKIKGTAREALK